MRLGFESSSCGGEDESDLEVIDTAVLQWVHSIKLEI